MLLTMTKKGYRITNTSKATSQARGKIMKNKQVFYFEYTDLFGGECNYCWLRKYAVKATTLRGACNVLSKFLGGNFRFDGDKFVSLSNCSAYYDITDGGNVEVWYAQDFESINFEGETNAK